MRQFFSFSPLIFSLWGSGAPGKGRFAYENLRFGGQKHQSAS
jgi:hypothetical protein